ncbi:V-type ATP synthase subunit D [Clostridiaceae bacterium HSG29]|nr:V-type ATP synthase subunit D [Clostridiaceae bacterium HSG29]
MIPTKANLMKCEEILKFSQKGFELLDKKRNILIQEMMTLVKRAEIIQSEINDEFIVAYDSLEIANIMMGRNSVKEFSLAVEEENEYKILLTSVMGVEIPKIKYNIKEPVASYSFFRTNSSFDNAVLKFNELKYMIYELSEVETSVYKLAMEIKKTKKRANALEKIRIPMYINLIKEIKETLEEKEREDFFRLKVLKDRKS